MGFRGEAALGRGAVGVEELIGEPCAFAVETCERERDFGNVLVRLLLLGSRSWSRVQRQGTLVALGRAHAAAAARLLRKPCSSGSRGRWAAVPSLHDDHVVAFPVALPEIR